MGKIIKPAFKRIEAKMILAGVPQTEARRSLSRLLKLKISEYREFCQEFKELPLEKRAKEARAALEYFNERLVQVGQNPNSTREIAEKAELTLKRNFLLKLLQKQ